MFYAFVDYLLADQANKKITFTNDLDSTLEVDYPYKINNKGGFEGIFKPSNKPYLCYQYSEKYPYKGSLGILIGEVKEILYSKNQTPMIKVQTNKDPTVTVFKPPFMDLPEVGSTILVIGDLKIGEYQAGKFNYTISARVIELIDPYPF